MRTFALAAVLMSVGLFTAYDDSAKAGGSGWFMAFCNDGDGPVSEWVNTRNEAYLAGRDHERSYKAHRWEVLVQQGETLVRPASCALVADGAKPETVRMENICDTCRRFSVTRTMKDGTVKSKEFTVKGKSGRTFRKLEGAVISVAGEADCPN